MTEIIKLSKKDAYFWSYEKTTNIKAIDSNATIVRVYPLFEIQSRQHLPIKAVPLIDYIFRDIEAIQNPYHIFTSHVTLDDSYAATLSLLSALSDAFEQNIKWL